MFAFMMRRGTAPGGAEKEETALHVPPTHAAHSKASYLLNGTSSGLRVPGPFLKVGSGVLLLGGGMPVCTDQSAMNLPPLPPGQQYARLWRNTGEDKAGFLVFRSRS